MFRNLWNIENIVRSPLLARYYDLFHCPHLSPIALAGIPRVTTIHDLIPLLRPELVSDKSRLVFAKLLRFNLHHSTHIIAVSETTRRDLIQHCNVPPDRISVIYEAASSHFRPIPLPQAVTPLRSINLLDSSGQVTPYFLFIGNIEPKKNLKRLLLAFKQFAASNPQGYRLVIVGAKAWGYRPVQPLLEELIQQGRLIWTGYLPSHYLPALLSCARAFVFPSLVEGFGLPVLEAMACGCPVITSHIPAITEVCGDAALQVNPLSVPEIYQAIDRLSWDDDLCAQLRQKGLRRNPLFSWDICADQTMQVYQSLCHPTPHLISQEKRNFVSLPNAIPNPNKKGM
ncbi:MAG: glycosyltransferase family 1 protein [Leptolyngbyaceae cyanobacterium bins.59]|nr:glycosyltransferase family 1 protein [Leptolyngbyaceae cyanobacterium bins.59]